jgi:hypothetical protein
VSSVVDESPGQRAREALARHDWGEAYEVMTEADRAGTLGPEDLEVLAQSAWWVGQQDTASDAWERAYTLYARSGDKLAAANAAAQLAFNLLWGWLSVSAERVGEPGRASAAGDIRASCACLHRGRAWDDRLHRRGPRFCSRGWSAGP